ncbi:MAG: insulinase family protein [Phycisphaeraceae bacterium]|nr:insulinase family protein [Phycisphaeraceae bacterium]
MARKFDAQVLDNGLTLLMETDDEAHSAAVGFFVKAGSRDENPVVMGVSHFLEHMMFKGSQRRTAEDVNRQFDEIGANYNAYTSQEATVYYAQILPEYLDQAIDLLADMLRPALRDDDFTMEKNVILEEIGMYADRPQSRLHDAIFESHFRDHALAYRILGTEETIGTLTAEQMRAYFDQRYAADRIIVTVTGSFDADKVKRQIVEATGHWRPSGVQRHIEVPVLRDTDVGLQDAKLSRHYLAAIWPGPGAEDELRYTATVLGEVLGAATGSRLYWAMVDPGLCDEAELGYMAFDHTGAFIGFVTCEPARAEQAQTVLFRTLDSARGDLKDDEVERAKSKIATHAMLTEERPMGRMQSLGGTWLYLGRHITLEEKLEKIMAVTTSDLEGLLARTLESPRTLVRLGPTVKT